MIYDNIINIILSITAAANLLLHLANETMNFPCLFPFRPTKLLFFFTIK